METFYEVMRRQGISRRSLLKFCSLTATSLGLGPAFVPQIAHAMENKPRTPVLWLHGLECTCCSESFIRSSHPLVADILLDNISLDYTQTLQAAAGVLAVLPCVLLVLIFHRRISSGLTEGYVKG